MRRLAVEFAGTLRTDAPSLVHAALRLQVSGQANPLLVNFGSFLMDCLCWQDLCNVSAPPVTPAPVRMAAVQGAPGAVLHVDGSKGSDSGDGSVSQPFQTVEKALSASRALPNRAGTTVAIQLVATPTNIYICHPTAIPLTVHL